MCCFMLKLSGRWMSKAGCCHAHCGDSASALSIGYSQTRQNLSSIGLVTQGSYSLTIDLFVHLCGLAKLIKGFAYTECTCVHKITRPLRYFILSLHL